MVDTINKPSNCNCQCTHQSLISNDSPMVKPLIEKIKEMERHIDQARRWRGNQIPYAKKEVKKLHVEVSEACKLIQSTGMRALDIEMQLLEINNMLNKL